MEDPKDKPAFALGDQVEKIGGRYGGPGRVVSVSEDLGDGYRLFGVAMKVEGGYGEFVHVFPAAVLKKLEKMSEKGRFLLGGLSGAQPRGRASNAGQYGVGAMIRLVHRPHRGATRKMECGEGGPEFSFLLVRAAPFPRRVTKISSGEEEVISWKQLARSAKVTVMVRHLWVDDDAGDRGDDGRVVRIAVHLERQHLAEQGEEGAGYSVRSPPPAFSPALRMASLRSCVVLLGWPWRPPILACPGGNALPRTSLVTPSP